MSDKAITDHVNHEIWTEDFPDLYWPSKPVDLYRADRIQQIITKEFVLNSYSGSYRSSDSMQQCIIREISGNKLILEYLAREEATNLQYLADQDFIAKHYGFYLNSIDQGQLKYVMVFQEYPHTWENLKNYDNEEIKIKLSRQALNALMIMQDLRIYHGSLSALNMYLDSNFNLKIGNFLHSGVMGTMQDNFSWILRGLSLIEKNYASPEQRFALFCLKNGFLIHPYNPIKADIFSLGACILTTVPNTKIFNQLKGLGPRHYRNTKINKSSAYNNKLLKLDNRFMHVKKSIDTLEREINKEICKCRNERVQFLLLGMMNVYYEDRSDYAELLNILNNVKKVDLDGLKILPSIESSTEDPEYQVYADILKSFNKSLQRARSLMSLSDNHLLVFVKEINRILNRYKEEFQIAKRQQLSCLI